MIHCAGGCGGDYEEKDIRFIANSRPMCRACALRLLDSFGDSPRDPMVPCFGCGFHVEKQDVVEREECSDRCITCKLCEAEPRLKESYRRGFNAGLDALAKAVVDIARGSGLRKRPPPIDQTEWAEFMSGADQPQAEGVSVKVMDVTYEPVKS
jgi:hypothetical protein